MLAKMWCWWTLCWCLGCGLHSCLSFAFHSCEWYSRVCGSFNYPNQQSQTFWTIPSRTLMRHHHWFCFFFFHSFFITSFVCVYMSFGLLMLRSSLVSVWVLSTVVDNAGGLENIVRGITFACHSTQDIFTCVETEVMISRGIVAWD